MLYECHLHTGACPFTYLKASLIIWNELGISFLYLFPHKYSIVLASLLIYESGYFVFFHTCIYTFKNMLILQRFQFFEICQLFYGSPYNLSCVLCSRGTVIIMKLLVECSINTYPVKEVDSFIRINLIWVHYAIIAVYFNTEHIINHKLIPNIFILVSYLLKKWRNDRCILHSSI